MPVSTFDFRFSTIQFLPPRCNISGSMTQSEIESKESLLPPSKRAARRILQRAFVLTGRDRQLRQHIREARLTTLWILEDWDLVWTVTIDHGKIEFERRPAKHQDLTLSWQTASEFFSCAREGTLPESRLEWAGNLESTTSCKQPAQVLSWAPRSRASEPCGWRGGKLALRAAHLSAFFRLTGNSKSDRLPKLTYGERCNRVRAGGSESAW